MQDAAAEEQTCVEHQPSSGPQEDNQQRQQSDSAGKPGREAAQAGLPVEAVSRDFAAFNLRHDQGGEGDRENGQAFTREHGLWRHARCNGRRARLGRGGWRVPVNPVRDRLQQDAAADNRSQKERKEKQEAKWQQQRES